MPSLEALEDLHQKSSALLHWWLP